MNIHHLTWLLFTPDGAAAGGGGALPGAGGRHRGRSHTDDIKNNKHKLHVFTMETTQKHADLKKEK